MSPKNRWTAQILVALAACLYLDAAQAEDFSVIDPTLNPGRARFMQVAQAKFDKDHKALFQTSHVPPEDEQGVFECMMKAVLADIPDAEAAKAADMVEGKVAPDPSMAKWFAINKHKYPERYQQVVDRSRVICPQYADILKY